MAQEIQIKIHGPETVPTLVYLPGIHGNWSLLGGFRRAVGGRVRLVELSYPPTLTWRVEDYAAAVESALAAHGITRGWLLAESFGSLVAWPILSRRRFQAEGLILAGGFARHPTRWGARLVERVIGATSLPLLTRILFGYAKMARLRFRRSPETVSDIREFVAGFNEEHRRAAMHRLRVVAESDLRSIAREVRVPCYAMTGAMDPVVPWPWVRRWLRKNCPTLKAYRIFWRADHNVLGTAPQGTADQVVGWIGREAPQA